MALQNLVFACFFFAGSIRFSTGHAISSDYNVGDEETTVDPSTTTSSSSVVFMNRADYRELRLEHIRREILQRLGWREPPKINSQSVADVRQVLASEYNNLLHANQLTEERRCFSTSCNLHRNINTTLWSNRNSLGWRLYTGGTARLKNSIRNVVTAQLKLFLRIPEGFRCNNSTNVTASSSARFLVSVYQFIRPLRMRTQRTRRRIQNRKRMIDARMVSSHNQWVSLNVKTAVSEWVTERRHNYGFEIGVRDESENECNASVMFVPVICDRPVEMGCVEEDVNTTPIFTPILPWARPDVETNFPYLEVSYNVRRRTSRDTSHVVQGSFQNESPLDLGHNQCFGVKTRIEIKEKWILSPSHFTSLVCSGTCKKQQTDKNMETCHSTSTRQLEGLYLNDRLRVQRGLLPYTQVLECGCRSHDVHVLYRR
ncbi:uncharacterized protein LOC121381703 [Gigantopelta aegis]|uniref:uncharacterized protein LOC121381703 n=1 Tax=Gigantopelta aegis TaxID=1735272 RepID=UPI001B88AB14|nr:uncharacterized protein LOC121381703 [Gigantopelta aegis]